MLETLIRVQLRFASSRAALVAPSVAQTVHKVAPAVNHSPEKALERRWLPLRCGVLTRKVGMMPYFDVATGARMAATVLEMNNVEVVLQKTVAANGYWACQVGYGNKHPSKVTRQLLGHFASKEVNPKEKVTEFRVKNEEGLLPVGTLLKPSFFSPGQYVDLRSVSKGKGFQGVMKRYNFKGQKASHGNSLSHRKGGSYGQNQTPGRILPGKKMPGHMGVQRVTIQNVQVLEVQDSKGVIIVKGSVAGPKGAFVKVQDAIKKPPTADI
ncbi:ADL129Wp [Eremothecium gossypii ATCC 10895]|uniref:Large ribosomal subunit protein uL3m n=1 Tax=Eremothecium gossypii (strain ATCC 10895 / CBS 109.51 / FGSC 9923 / NRRL Y-1056) TaxID=284811 RepID=Q75AP9_EREGS|nr:mitochondrial 54S ribosomal protein YmL9 [Eremothecium gossypii ATCC 10895]AAS51791.2 ADL129Wp [Eremothecium gossypii ATCC 10895]AEY96089.1 FADL129Wp [Eremothecium gossypii FDAG1]